VPGDDDPRIRRLIHVSGRAGVGDDDEALPGQAWCAVETRGRLMPTVVRRTDETEARLGVRGEIGQRRTTSRRGGAPRRRHRVGRGSTTTTTNGRCGRRRGQISERDGGKGDCSKRRPVGGSRCDMSEGLAGLMAPTFGRGWRNRSRSGPPTQEKCDESHDPGRTDDVEDVGERGRGPCATLKPTLAIHDGSTYVSKLNGLLHHGHGSGNGRSRMQRALGGLPLRNRARRPRISAARPAPQALAAGDLGTSKRRLQARRISSHIAALGISESVVLRPSGEAASACHARSAFAGRQSGTTNPDRWASSRAHTTAYQRPNLRRRFRSHGKARLSVL